MKEHQETKSNTSLANANQPIGKEQGISLPPPRLQLKTSENPIISKRKDDWNDSSELQESEIGVELLQRKTDSHEHQDACTCPDCTAQMKMKAPQSAKSDHLPAASVLQMVPYREVNDLTVLQGGASGTDCPLTLKQLFELFTLDGPATRFDVTNRDGNSQSVRFTRDWVYGPQGVAVLRGRIRYEVARQMTGAGENILSLIDALTGNAQRIQELREGLQTARSRAQANPEQARTTGAYLVEEARGDGMAWNTRAHLGGALHAAWDVAGRRNTGVYTPVGGTVVYAGRGAGYGKRVKILHPNGPDGQGRPRPVYTNYCHLDEMLVSRGDQVHPGQAVGLMGNMRFDARGVTTIAGINTHLHFSVQTARRGATAETATTTLSSDVERTRGIHPQQWFNSVTGSAHPYRTITTEPTSGDQTREVLELEGAGISRDELRMRRSGGLAPTSVGEISEPSSADSAPVQEKADPEKSAPIQAKEDPSSIHTDGCSCPGCSGVVVQKLPVQRQQVIQRLTDMERYENTLRSAGTSRTAWDSNYLASATFLGMDIRDGIHQELSNRLVLAETYLRTQFPGRSDDDIRTEIGLYSASGRRPVRNAVGGSKLSFHSFGLAIDVNYRGNPFIGRSDEVDEIINRIFQFMTGGTFHIATTQRGTPEEIRSRFSGVSQAFASYFRMRGNRDMIRAHLVSRGEIMPAVSGETNPRQAEDDRRVQQVFDQIEADATDEHLLADMEMTRVGPRALTAGFIDLSQTLVEALSNQADLYWGALYRTGKDIMHFDWRSGTIGDGDRE